MRLNFVLLEEVLKMSGSAFIKGSILRPFFHQQSGVCPPMQIGLYSKEWGEAHPPSSRHSMGSVFGLFQRGKQNGRDPALFGASESGSSKAQLKVFECLASLSPLRRMRREGGTPTPCWPLFLLTQKSDPEEPFTCMTDWRMEPCRGAAPWKEPVLMEAGKEWKGEVLRAFFPSRKEENIERLRLFYGVAHSELLGWRRILCTQCL